MFEIGDKVRYIGNAYHFLSGKTGVIKQYKYEMHQGVEFDEYDRRLHDCDRHTERNRGYWILPRELEKCEYEIELF